MGIGRKIRALFTANRSIGEELLEELEDTLIEGDLGAGTAMEIGDELRARLRNDPPGGKSVLGGKEAVIDCLKSILRKYVLTAEYQPNPDRLNMVLVLGVNGVGKTTSIAKMAQYYSRRGFDGRIVLSAGDTFRAAAIDQLKYHGAKQNIRVVAQNPGSDPGAVIYDTIESARAHGETLIIADTAGRMHNKANLVAELGKINRIVERRIDKAEYFKLCVIDANTGQNGLRQVEIFHEAVGIDGIILAKYDSTAKGGMVIPICRDLKLPFVFMGTGEKMTDLEPFHVEKYLQTLMDD